MSGNGHDEFMMHSNGDPDKKARVEEMFDAIAPTYDALNHILSLGIDKGWRRKVVKAVAGFREKHASAALRSMPDSSHTFEYAADPASSQALHLRTFDENSNEFGILDVATGTGDLAIALARRLPQAGVTGVDISEGMLAAGREKVLRAGLGERVVLRTGDAEALDFADGAFEGVTVAFGVRNFGDIPAGLAEMCRVLRQGGKCWVLEFSEPTAPLFGWVYRFYFHRVLPWLGRLVSRDRGAYSYLPRSVDGFPPPERFSAMLREAGFAAVRTKKLTFGVAYIYEAVKN